MKRAVRAAAVAVVAVGLAFGGLGFVIARRLTAPVSERRYDITILGVDDSREQRIIVLDRTQATASVGDYCIILENGDYVQLAPEVQDRGPQFVGRKVVGESGEHLHVGQRVSWSGIYFATPADAALPSMDVEVPTDVGPAPAWLIAPHETSSTTWAIHIHGLGSTRVGTLRGVQVAFEAGLTSLVVTHRNDGEGPRVRKGRSELGAAEVADVREAVDYAVDHGAQTVILFGWSMGGAIALQLSTEPKLGGIITGLVLESPVLDWVSTVQANCVRSGLPDWAGTAALPWLRSQALALIVGLTTPVRLREFDWISRANELTVPTLILHGAVDTSSPISVAVKLHELRPDRVDLVVFHADHTMTWNSDQHHWRAVSLAWLAARELSI